MKIVLVEASRIGRKILAEMLEKQLYSVVCFSDGSAAYDYVKNGGEIDVLLTGMEVAGMSGLELCWQIRDLVPDENPLYIMVMSSSVDIDNAVMALDSGADDYVGKPPNPPELYAKLRSGQRLINMQKELHRLAHTDDMTGLLNRRAFLSKADNFVELLGQGANCLSAILLDIDRFKSVNDTYGHLAGDAAICAVADVLKSVDFVSGRLGGEEFSIVLPHKTLEEGAELAEQLRQSIEALSIVYENISFSITASFGVSEWRQSGSDTLTNLLKRSDEALYAVKEGGRNKVVVSPREIDAIAS